MTVRSCVLSIAGLVVAGSLGAGVSGASAQAIIVDPYLDPYPVVVAPPVIVAPRPILAPAPIVRERIVVSRPAYAVPAWGAPVPRFGYPARAGYGYPDW
jgi:hypothetical protein